MPPPPTEPDAPPFPPRVCVCGYDLAGLPPDAAARCPECGVVIATIVPRVPRFHHWGRTLAAAASPSLCATAALVLFTLFPRATVPGLLASVLFFCGILSVFFFSIPALVGLLVQATRPPPESGRGALVALAVVLSLLVNGPVIFFVAVTAA